MKIDNVNFYYKLLELHQLSSSFPSQHQAHANVNHEGERTVLSTQHPVLTTACLIVRHTYRLSSI